MDIRFQPRAPLGSPIGSTQGAHGMDGGEFTHWHAEGVIVPAFSGAKITEFLPALLDNEPWLEISPALRDFKGKKGEVLLAYGPPASPLPRVIFCGLGEAEKLRPGMIREAVAKAMQEAARLKLDTVALSLEALEEAARKAPASFLRGPGMACGSEKPGPAYEEVYTHLVEEAVLGAFLALYSCTAWRGAMPEDEAPFAPRSLSLLFKEKEVPDAQRLAARKAEALAKGIYLTRDLTNGPANAVTPAYLEEQAQALARRYGFRCTSLGPDYLKEEGFGAFYAVAQGAQTEPRLIILEHNPEGADPEAAPLIFVGKGVTFDSGGISLKPAAKMHEMKRDMAGAGTVLGLFAALGESLPFEEVLAKRRVIGVIPCAENMPDGKATRPGDIVTTLSGKTVEITNTDAEGRLLLCDSLTLAQRRWKPGALVDIATLTGACVVGLGENTAGLFGNDDKLRDTILDLGARTAERFWPLPIYDEDMDGLKSDTADLGNTGPREGGALFAALFLKQFIEKDTPWAHLDIAGPAYTSKKSPTCPGGATAVGLQTLYELVLAGAEQA